jgi:hypothetical protein
MNQVYEDILLEPGAKVNGIYQVKIVPKEWILEGPIIDMFTGTVSTLKLKTGYDWLNLSFTPKSYLYDEKSRSDKGGVFYDKLISGLLNAYNEDLHSILETFRYHQFVATVTDRNKIPKVIGDGDNGMKLKFDPRSSNNNGGQQLLQIELRMQGETTSPQLNDQLYLITEDEFFILSEEGEKILGG